MGTKDRASKLRTGNYALRMLKTAPPVLICDEVSLVLSRVIIALLLSRLSRVRSVIKVGVWSHRSLSDIIDKFVSEVSLGSSVDWFLIKLSSAIDELEELSRSSKDSMQSYLKAFLGDERVKRCLARFSCYLEEVERAIVSNPRFRSLRPYLNDIVEAIKSIPCISKETEYPYSKRPSHIHKQTVSRPLIGMLKSFAKPRFKTQEMARLTIESTPRFEKLTTNILYTVMALAAVLFILSVLGVLTG